MRVSENSLINNAIRNMGDAEERYAQLQQRASSQKAFQQVSDSPGVVSQVLSLRSSLQASQSYQATAQSTQGWLDANDTAFQGLQDLATSAIKTVTSGLTDTVSDSDRKDSLAPELDSILQNAVDMANTDYNGKYIFSGYQVTQKTFTYNTTTKVVDYNTPDPGGIPEIQHRDLGPGQTIAVNYMGDTAVKPLLDAITHARDALAPASGVFDRTVLDASLTELKNAMDNMSTYETQNGVHQRQVSTFLDQMDTTQTQINSLLTNKEDVSLAESITQLQQQQTVYQAVLEVGNRAISTLNLFSMLQ
jgi:flagellar hook-associated protein 3 FlgL